MPRMTKCHVGFCSTRVDLSRIPSDSCWHRACNFLDAMATTTNGPQAEGLDWDDEEIETQVFEHHSSVLPPPANSNSFLAKVDAETVVTDPDPHSLAFTAVSAREPSAQPASITAHATGVARAGPIPMRMGRQADRGFPLVSRSASSSIAQAAASPPLRSPGTPPWSPGTPAAAFWTPSLRPRRFQLLVLLLLVGGVGAYLVVPRSGMLQISVKPVDARLAIDGERVTAGPPFRLDKRAGIYRLTVSRPGYLPFDQRISIRARQRGEMDIVLQPSPDTGFALTSTPANALAWLDGQPLFLDKDDTQATTNLQATRITPGPHILELKGNAGYQPWAQEFVQEPGRIVSLHADLVAIPVGKDSRSLPQIVHARARAHLSSARKVSDGDGGGSRGTPQAGAPPAEGTDPFENDSWIASDKRARPEAASGNVTLTGRDQSADGVGATCIATISSKPWAEVSIDGKPTGKLTPLVNYALPCGKHRLSFKNEDLMIEQNESIALKPGRPFKKIFMLVDTDP
jgi:hypothetical protein